MPQLLQQMQNPSVQQLMANPEALQAIMQIQQVWILFLLIFDTVHIFLVAKLLYKSKCPSVCPSVCPSTTFRGKRDFHGP